MSMRIHFGFIRKLRVGSYWSTIFLFSLTIFSTGLTQPLFGDVFDIEEIIVDVTANSAAEAKNRAIKEGEARAFNSLISKLTIRRNYEQFTQFSAEEISNYIHNFSVSEEKTSNVRYIAKLNFRFKPEAMHKMFEEHEILFAETVSKPVLVLPVLLSGGAIMLWDDPNLWRQAWRQYKAKPSLVPIIVPIGDLKDVALLGAEQALSRDLPRLEAIGKRYKVGTTAVLVARIVDSKLGKNIEIEGNWDGVVGASDFFKAIVEGKKSETIEDTLSRAVNKVVEKMEYNWKQGNLVGLNKQTALNVTVPINNLDDWLAIRELLARIKILRDVELVFLSLREIRLHLQFLGEVKKLVLALAQEDLSLIQDNEEWLLIPANPNVAN